MLRKWVNTVIPSNCRMVEMYNTRCEGTTAASENCHITHFSTQSFQFSVLIFAPISCKNNHFAPSRPTFPPENPSHLRFPFPRAWVVPGWGWVPVTVWCVFTIGGKGGHWLLTSPYTELVRHHLPPARNCDRPLLTGRNKTHTNTKHQKLCFLTLFSKNSIIRIADGKTNCIFM